MRERDEPEIRPELADAIELLREKPAMRAEWRDELLRRASAPPAHEASRRLSLSMPSAVAAGIVCALIGAGTTLVLRRNPSPATLPAVTAVSPSSPATMPVRFSLDAPQAARVTIVGDFNNWNPTTLPMRRSVDGRVWEVEVRLPLGRYNYAFMVDGQLAADPGAPSTAADDFGKPSSVLMVRGS